MELKRRKYFTNTLAMLQEISPACNIRPLADYKIVSRHS
jgi:hypothetical protein